MNLLSINGNKTSNSDNMVKEKLLYQEIQGLRGVHQQCSAIFGKVVLLLKKILAYKSQHKDVEKNQVDIKNNFIQDLCHLQEILVNLTEALEYDRDLFVSCVIFRDSQKNLEGTCFKKMLKSYQNFKEYLNKVIHRLEQDIQKLETNGYHIYSNVALPNNVMQGVKKLNLERYSISLNEIQLIYQKMKRQMMAPQEQQLKKEFKITNKANFVKNQQCMKLLKQTFLKQHLHQEMMIEEISKIKMKIDAESRKAKIIQQAIEINKQSLENMNIQIGIYSENPYIQKTQVKIFCRNIREKVQQRYLPNPVLSHNSKLRSKSCHTIVMRSDAVKMNKKRVEESKDVGSSELIQTDFLQESIEI